MALTLVEKIATNYAVGLPDGEAALQGQIVRVRPKHVMTHDNTGAVIPKFLSIFEGTGASPKIAYPPQPVFAIDHDIQNESPANLDKYANIERFADEHGVDFYPAGTGISHQIMIEQGYVTPGVMCVGSDSHSNMYGALAALGTPVVRTDAACLWATGETWWQVPKVARCMLTGKLRSGVTGKDVIIALCGLFNQDEVLNHAVEFVGDGVASLSIDERLTISNMTTEWGALAGLFPFDIRLCGFLHDRADYFEAADGPLPPSSEGGLGRGAGGAMTARPGKRHAGSFGGYSHEDIDGWFRNALAADMEAEYAVELSLDLGTVIPHVSGPNEVKTMTSLPEMEGRRVAIQKAYLLSCTNARLEDLAAAADVIRGQKVAAGVEFFVAAASASIQVNAEASGAWNDLVTAGAIPLPSGCGPCIGLGRGTTEDGEVAISATNRNFKGRMGSREAQVYLGSPAVVAASAVAGYICGPRRFEQVQAVSSGPLPPSSGGGFGRGAAADAGAAPHPGPPPEDGGRGNKSPADIIDGFPEKISGRVLYLPKDNMNTDGIYAGKWTYQDDMTTDQMAAVTFENYDERFNEVFRKGDLVVSGRNFGTGSSREQAATALAAKGVPCVVAASFSETYRRNAFNNGFLCVECPGLVDHLASQYTPGEGEAPAELTVEGPKIEVDFQASVIRLGGESFPFPPLSTVAQELVVAGGAEAMARKKL